MVKKVIREGINGFCMALADSVPGVSGGTIAFILGFYDKFIGSINGIIFGNKEEKKSSLLYLIKLGCGWIIGMGLAVIVLSTMFEKNIYVISSLFIGFIAGSIPLVVSEEINSFQRISKGIVFCMLGIFVVVGITIINGHVGSTTMVLNNFSISLGIKFLVIGMVSISAMFLPGISGSTLLLIFGAYIPVITAVKGVLGLDISYLPALMFFGCGVLIGAITVVKIIERCLKKYRTQLMYAILGMMIGSFYAIIKGPTTLEIPKPAMNLFNFNIVACLVGLGLVLGIQWMKRKNYAKT